jgi:pyruvate kinase
MMQGSDDFDKDDGEDHSVDWIALSFVQTPADMVQFRKLVGGASAKVKIMAKLEKPSAIAYLDEVYVELFRNPSPH